jgi:hypothetical protein
MTVRTLLLFKAFIKKSNDFFGIISGNLLQHSFNSQGPLNDLFLTTKIGSSPSINNELQHNIFPQELNNLSNNLILL